MTVSLEPPANIRVLQERGVTVHGPQTVEVGPEVDPERIATGVVIHPGCRIRGKQTSIGPGCDLGREQPLTVDDCQLEREVRLAGGHVSGAVLLAGSSLGSAAHVRPATLLEEGARGAHTVGLKQTVLLPWVTLGSLVNFCDCLMGGGTGPDDHGEVGSSFVHFNFTTHGDKATPSLFGDVPHGVMLDRRPVFLGGQGGVVGPTRLAFGTVTAAGIVVRADELAEGRLVTASPLPASGSLPYDPATYGEIARLVRNNLIFLGNIRALQQWYAHARSMRMSADPFARACLTSAQARLADMREERIARLAELADRLARSVTILCESRLDPDGRLRAEQSTFVGAWPRLEAALRAETAATVGGVQREAFLAELATVAPGVPWPEAIQGMPDEKRRLGTGWLAAVAAEAATLSWGEEP